MTRGQELKDLPSMFSDERVLEWMEEHVMELRQSVTGQQILYRSLVISFVVGLAAHIGGYTLLSSLPVGPLGLLADLLHALGWSLWTGVVVAVFVQVIPEMKKRQIRRALEAYEALRSDRDRAAGDREGAVLERSHVMPAERGQGQKRRRSRARKGNKPR